MRNAMVEATTNKRKKAKPVGSLGAAQRTTPVRRTGHSLP
jgi:hypothetical protein